MSDRDRFQRALLLSLLSHLALMLVFGFLPPIQAAMPPQELEVVLVNRASSAEPLEATRLAQNAMDGGGDVDEDHHLASPLAASNAALAMATRREQQRVQALEKESKALMEALKAEVSVPRAQRETSPTPKPSSPGSLQNEREAQGPYFSGLESDPSGGEALSHEAAEIAREFDAYQKRPRRAAIGGRTRPYVFAAYEDHYRSRVERVGTEHYPPPHFGEPVYGKVRLTVIIDTTGKVLGVELNASSGDSYLDQAAVDTVYRAQPFGQFNAAMKKKADILEITRTFTFMRDSARMQAE